MPFLWRRREWGQLVRRNPALLVGVLLVLMAVFYFLCGFYTIQPLGSFPDGVTAIVWRGGDEPFFNSPDGRCLERVGSVSIMCRMAAVSAGPHDRIILRLPYMRWAYLASTGGHEFDR